MEEIILSKPFCLKCSGGKCSGFVQHQWRHNCNNCGCALWNHDIPVDEKFNPIKILQLQDNELLSNAEYADALSKGYLWLPVGVDTHTVEKFMSLLPTLNVPKLETEGAKERMKQLLFQLPVQDFDANAVRNLSEKAMTTFKQFIKTKNEELFGLGVVNTSLSHSMNCMKCNELIEEGEVAVSTDHFGTDSCWHPSCFVCCVDDMLLVDYVYFAYQKKLYCGRHFGEQIKPRCHACDELIFVGEYTKAMGKSWHQDHFRCHFCDDVLAKKKYAILDELPYCQICFNTKVAKLCAGCERLISIESKDFTVKEKHFHEECLVCRLCKTSLAKETFSFVNEQPICHKCRGIDPEKSMLCKQCHVYFEDDEKKLFVGTDYYHENCFLCHDCKNVIGTQKFIKKNDDRHLCQECFKLTAKVCGKCDKYIKNSAVKFEGQSFHMECFHCTSCKTQLAGTQFYKQLDDPFCESCFLSKFAKCCSACLQPIEGNTKFIDYDSKYWHSKCFACMKCNTTLAGQKFVVRNGSRFCILCSRL